jgi:hypothetical protein
MATKQARNVKKERKEGREGGNRIEMKERTRPK